MNDLAGGAKPGDQGTLDLSSRALVLLPRDATPRRARGLHRSHGVIAAAVAAVMGLGFVAATALFAGQGPSITVARAAPPPETAMVVIDRVQGEVRALRAGLDGLRSTAESRQQDETIRALKRSVEVLKQDLETAKATSTALAGQVSAKLDRLDRDPLPRLTEIVARLDKLDREPATKLGEVTARLDRIERQVSAEDRTGSLPPQQSSQPVPTPIPPPRLASAAPASAASPTGPSATLRTEPTPIPPPRLASAAPASAASPTGPSATLRTEPAPRPTARVASAAPLSAASPTGPSATLRTEPAPRPTVPVRQDNHSEPVRPEATSHPATVSGWLLRDVYGGMALLEGRSGLREVAPGEFVPGVGEVRSIERRGRSWVVVTSRGLIQADNRW